MSLTPLVLPLYQFYRFPFSFSGFVFALPLFSPCPPHPSRLHVTVSKTRSSSFRSRFFLLVPSSFLFRTCPVLNYIILLLVSLFPLCFQSLFVALFILPSFFCITVPSFLSLTRWFHHLHSYPSSIPDFEPVSCVWQN